MKSKKQVLGTETGKFCLDVAKLIIGGVILASIVKKDIDPILLISVGFIFVTKINLKTLTENIIQEKIGENNYDGIDNIFGILLQKQRSRKVYGSH